jgi:hypothetical protein
VRARIEPLTLQQGCRYIQHRSQCAGRIGKPPLFTTPALWYLAFTAHGIPRTINICCDNALINGYGHGAERISLKIARESCRSLRFRAPFPRVAVLAATAVVLVGTALSRDAFLQHFLAVPARGKVLEFGWRDRPAAYETDVTKASAPPTVAATPLPGPPLAAEPIRTPPAPVGEAETASPPALPTSVHPIVEAPPAKAPAAPQSDSVGTVAIVEPNPATVPTPELPRTATASAAAEPTNPRDPQPWRTRQWFVRSGDTVTKACQVTYGVCDETALKAVFAYNPQIGPNGLIRQGQIIIMPERVGLARSN